MSLLTPPTDKERICIEFVRANLKAAPEKDDTSFVLDDLTIWRFARANEAKRQKTLEAIEATLKWRREYRPYAVTVEEAAPFFELGVSRMAGKTKSGVPVLYFAPKDGVVMPAEQRVRAQIWLLEEMHRRGIREIVTIADFQYITKSPSDEDNKTRELNQKITSDHYPLIGSRSYVFNMGTVLKVVLKVVIAFMPKWQKEVLKMEDRKELAEMLHESDVPVPLGGRLALHDAGIERLLEALPPAADYDVADAGARIMALHSPASPAVAAAKK